MEDFLWILFVIVAVVYNVVVFLRKKAQTQTQQTQAPEHHGEVWPKWNEPAETAETVVKTEPEWDADTIGTFEERRPEIRPSEVRSEVRPEFQQGTRPEFQPESLREFMRELQSVDRSASQEEIYASESEFAQAGSIKNRPAIVATTATITDHAAAGDRAAGASDEAFDGVSADFDRVSAGSGNAGLEAGEIIKDFDLRRAVIYSEILKPKFDQQV